MNQATSRASLPLLLASLALFFAWLAPGHYYPWISFQNEWVAALSGLLFALHVLVRSPSARWPLSSLVVLGAAAVAAVQWASGQILFRSDGVMALLYLTGLAGAIAVGGSLPAALRRQFLDALLGALLAAGIASVGLAAVQWLGLADIGYVAYVPPGERPIANIAQPNHLASLFAIALLAGLWFYETRRIDGRVLWLAAVWLAIGMAMTRSRMVWVVVAAFAVGWTWFGRHHAVRLKPSALYRLVAAFAVLVAISGPLSQALTEAAPASFVERLQGGGRLKIWTTLLDALLQSPWVGYGWTQVSRAGLAGSASHYTGETMLRNGHSLPLDLLIWNGIPLGLLFIGLLGWWWWRQLRRCDSAERAVVLAVVGVASIHSLVEFPLEYFYFLVPVGLLVGVLEGGDRGVAVHGAGAKASRPALAGLTAVLAAMSVWVLVEYVQAEEASRENRMLAARYASHADLPALLLLDEPIEYMRFWRTQARAGMSPADLDWMRRIAERNPAPPTLLRYATAMALNNRWAEAELTLVQLCNMHNRTRCNEGRESWRKLQEAYPTLARVPFPATPEA